LGDFGEPGSQVGAAGAVEVVVAGGFVLFDLVEEVPAPLGEVGDLAFQPGDRWVGCRRRGGSGGGS
jgi:hypothetical protein